MMYTEPFLFSFLVLMQLFYYVLVNETEHTPHLTKQRRHTSLTFIANISATILSYIY